MAGLRIRIQGAGAGWILILFPMTAVYHFLHVLMGTPPAPRTLTEMERSAVQEVGNILASSFLSELGDLVDRRFFPSPPEIRLEDIPQMVREVLASVQTFGAEVLALQGSLEDRERHVEGRVVVLSEVSALEAVARGAPAEQEIPR